jgi:glutathione S-transferase
MREIGGERLAWFDGELGKRPYLAGDRFTVADITLLCAIDFGKVSQIRIGDAHPNLKKWHATVSARPSATA